MSRLLFAFMLLSSPSQAASGLDTVIQRAVDYVARYEAALGNLIGSEEYVQNAAWTSTGGRAALVTRRQQRRTAADFLLLQFGTEWAAFRKVNRVDGNKVSEKQASFEDSFDDTPQANARRLRSLVEESREYNIGDVLREINVPTFALAVVRKEEVGRFVFEKAGTDKINGVLTWAVRFKEVNPPTLVVNGIPSADVARTENREPLFSKGTLWIDPDSGEILKTDFYVENHYTPSLIKARVIVTYSASKKVEMLVPALMLEHYEVGNNTVECRADYSNFRRFEVDVKVDMGPPKP